MGVIINPKYKRIGSDARFSIITGGRGSGKSFSVTYLISLMSYEAGHTILYTRYTLTSAHISIIPEFLEKIELINRLHEFTIKKDEIINNISGSRILFRGIKTSSGDQTANLKSIQGLSVWVLDESEELSEESKFDTVNLSVRQKGVQNRVILLMNPTTKEHWVYNRFFEQRGIEPGTNDTVGDTNYIHTTYLDNIDNLSQSFIDDIERLKKHDIDKYNHQILGGWLDKAEGVVFTNWEIGEFKDNGQTLFGQDYGFSIDPTTLSEVSVFTDRKEIYIKELLYKTGMSTDEIFQVNKRYAGDSLIIGDSAEPRLIDELKSKGNNIEPAVKGQGSVTAGIAQMQDYKLIIDPNSLNLIRELNNYQWSDKKKSTPVDKWNDILDGVRYAVVKHLEPKQELFFF